MGIKKTNKKKEGGEEKKNKKKQSTGAEVKGSMGKEAPRQKGQFGVQHDVYSTTRAKKRKKGGGSKKN